MGSDADNTAGAHQCTLTRRKAARGCLAGPSPTSHMSPPAINQVAGRDEIQHICSQPLAFFTSFCHRDMLVFDPVTVQRLPRRFMLYIASSQ